MNESLGVSWMREARIVFAFFLMGWYFRAGFGWERVADAGQLPVLRWGRFPEWFSHPLLTVITFWLPLLALPFFCCSRRWALSAGSAIALLSAFLGCAGLLLHNDASNVAAFWGCAWLLAWCLSVTDDPASWRLPVRLAVCVVSLLYLGGFVGKLTPEYWDGSAMHTMFFVERQESYWLFKWVHKTFAPEEVRSLATWYSRLAITGEGMVALGFWLPPRVFFFVALSVMLGMMVFCAPDIFSVVAVLIGMLLVVWRLTAPDRCNARDS